MKPQAVIEETDWVLSGKIWLSRQGLGNIRCKLRNISGGAFSDCF